jgi:two-component system NarL family sensor kinase
MHMEDVRLAVGLATTICLFFITGTMIFSIVLLSNARKKTHLQEKDKLQQQFREELLQTQLEMQEQTFNSISQEIHDNVGQTLSLVKVQLNILQQKKSLDMALVEDARDCVGKAMSDLRDIANSLNTKRVEQSTLSFLAENELRKINRLGMFETVFETAGEEKPITEKKKLVIFRIVQEALQNVIKHSKARNISVNLIYEKESLTTTVSDDGIGFNASTIPGNAGLGLQNLIDRASLIGGQALISSEVDCGTKVIVKIPYE